MVSTACTTIHNKMIAFGFIVVFDRLSKAILVAHHCSLNSLTTLSATPFDQGSWAGWFLNNISTSQSSLTFFATSTSAGSPSVSSSIFVVAQSRFKIFQAFGTCNVTITFGIYDSSVDGLWPASLATKLHCLSVLCLASWHLHVVHYVLWLFEAVHFRWGRQVPV